MRRCSWQAKCKRSDGGCFAAHFVFGGFSRTTMLKSLIQSSLHQFFPFISILPSETASTVIIPRLAFVHTFSCFDGSFCSNFEFRRVWLIGIDKLLRCLLQRYLQGEIEIRRPFQTEMPFR